MSFSYGAKIVTDGLVFYVDAANPNSYVSGNTTVDSLVSNVTGSLINDTDFSTDNQGTWVFDGLDDYAIFPNFTDIQGNSEFTVDGWFKRSGTWSGGATWGLGGNATRQGINSWNYNNSNEIAIDLWGTSTYSSEQTYSLTEWKHCVWVYNGSGFTTSNIFIYVDGVEYTGGNLTILRGGSGTPNINSTGLVLSRAGTTINNYYGKPIISNFKVYDRALSQTEIIENYNALKGRFGL